MQRQLGYIGTTAVSVLLTGHIASSRGNVEWGPVGSGNPCTATLQDWDGTTRFFTGGTNCSTQSGVNVYASDSSGYLASGTQGCGPIYAPDGAAFVPDCQVTVSYLDTN